MRSYNVRPKAGCNKGEQYTKFALEGAMDHHVDRRVVLSEKSEFKNLYPWFLHEVDAQGANVGGDLIPWEWSFRFTVSELGGRPRIRTATSLRAKHHRWCPIARRRQAGPHRGAKAVAQKRGQMEPRMASPSAP